MGLQSAIEFRVDAIRFGSELRVVVLLLLLVEVRARFELSENSNFEIVSAELRARLSSILETPACKNVFLRHEEEFNGRRSYCVDLRATKSLRIHKVASYLLLTMIATLFSS